jgi:hypothetical protein
MMIAVHRSCSLFAILLCFLLTGCSGQGEGFATVTGRVTEKGQPIKIDNKGFLRIEFLQFASGEGKRQVMDARGADINAEGKYSVEVRPGKYAVRIIHQPEYRGPNVLEKVFPGVDSPIVKQIDSDLQLDIEVDEFRKGS